ncbi:hypothetical protein [Nostoc sp.]|uniref:hypothetical protein n=1 Tax=Nostoc sp. TaxID=1180 RepID=UPI002FFC504B
MKGQLAIAPLAYLIISKHRHIGSNQVKLSQHHYLFGRFYRFYAMYNHNTEEE